ncbi:MAG: hypothetical protein EOO10_09250 [Chitinophagaceae bacterium]|nr:MAG: hypothetical protein EOO10_09250 [Chitinophagaceae bacterium]
MTKTYCLVLATCLGGLFSCSGGPSDEDIKKKILLEYVCMETAEVEDLKVVESKKAETISDAKGYEYTVSGDVVWKDGCNESLRPTPAGYKERFENKKVYLVKTEGEWR